MIALLIFVFIALLACSIREHPEYESNKQIRKLAKASKAKRVCRRTNQRRRWDPNGSRNLIR